MKKNLKAIFTVAAIVLTMAIAIIPTGCSGGSSAGPNTVTMKNLMFSPSTLTVSVGTTVTWKNTDSLQHTVTSDTGLFDSGLFGSGATYTHTFSTAGTYPYHCTIHAGMVGTIIVQ